MARFNCNLPALAARTSAQVSAAALEVMDREDTNIAEEASSGPGWFDSSRELVRGLEVTESAPGDSALNEWIRLCLAR
ncbi:MAG: hypothetical protein ABI433_20105 [Burkholderiaceae bacterium]